MYKKQYLPKETMKGIKTYVGESIENKMKRVLANGEAIKDTAPLTYTDRKDGVLPDYDIRTDKYEHLIEGFDALAKSKRARKDGVAKAQKELDKENEKLQNGAKGETGGQSTQAT